MTTEQRAADNLERQVDQAAVRLLAQRRRSLDPSQAGTGPHASTQAPWVLCVGGCRVERLGLDARNTRPHAFSLS